jgi:hypothetical protein
MTMSAVRPRATGHPGYNVTLPCEEATAEKAKRLVRTALSAWELDHLADAASLIVCELIANAVRHTSSRSIRVQIDRPSPGWVRLAVVDKSSRPPELCKPEETEERGRGLLLVDALADRWGYDLMGSNPQPWGKRCWAELRTDAQSAL